jgi:hypothetical protein
VDLLVEPGDTIELYRYSDFKLMGAYKVAAVDEKNACYIIDGRISESYPDTQNYRICNPSKAAKLKVHNSIIGNKRNRGMLLQTRNIEIPNCTFMNIVHGPLQIFSVYNEFMEGIMPRDVVVKDCKFLNNCGVDVNVFVWGRNGGIAQGVLKNVRTENNFFYGSVDDTIIYSGAGNCSIKNNLIAYSKKSRPVNIQYSSTITASDNVVVDISQKSLCNLGNGNSGITQNSNTSTVLSKPTIIYDSRK